MEYLLTFNHFVEQLKIQKAEQEKKRFQELAGIRPSNFLNRYAIQITIHRIDGLLIEHNQYTQFQKTTNRYTYHPENPSIPVKAHYHIYPSNSKKELYAVNVDDGTAHHKSNRGYVVPKKEAEELRSLGVNIPNDNILESKLFTINESNSDEFWTTFILIDDDEQ
jgi:hypothetical protein